MPDNCRGGCCKSLWLVVGGCGLLWLIVAPCGLLWVVVVRYSEFFVFSLFGEL